jgi:predicted ATP-grasp superfamily ATP-dependent carboligase
VLYTGGLENYPAVIAELAATRELFGNPPEVVDVVRNPWQMAACRASPADAGFTMPRVVPRGEPCPNTGRWVRKPLRSAGGLGMRFAVPGEPASPDHYFQEFIDGVPMSAVYSGKRLVGVSEQLVGEPWLHARSFGYCGNIGPIPEPDSLNGVAKLGLRGVWNLDFVRRDGVPYSVEVNPRYTASSEVLEHATGRALFGSLAATRSGARSAIGKAIYYAPRAFTFPDAGPWDADLAGAFDPWRLPAFADIPAPGTEFPAGSPVITLFERASSPAGCRERLQYRAAELDHLFGVTPP